MDWLKIIGFLILIFVVGLLIDSTSVIIISILGEKEAMGTWYAQLFHGLSMAGGIALSSSLTALYISLGRRFLFWRKERSWLFFLRAAIGSYFFFTVIKTIAVVSGGLAISSEGFVTYSQSLITMGFTYFFVAAYVFALIYIVRKEEGSFI